MREQHASEQFLGDEHWNKNSPRWKRAAATLAPYTVGRAPVTEKRALIGGAPGCQGSQRSGDRKPPSGPMEGVRREVAIDFDRFVCLKRAGS